MTRRKNFFRRLLETLRDFFRPKDPCQGLVTARPLVVAGKKHSRFLCGGITYAMCVIRRTYFYRSEDGSPFSVEVSWTETIDLMTGITLCNDCRIEKTVWYPSDTACFAAMTDPAIGGLSREGADAAIRKT